MNVHKLVPRRINDVIAGSCNQISIWDNGAARVIKLGYVDTRSHALAQNITLTAEDRNHSWNSEAWIAALVAPWRINLACCAAAVDQV